MLSKLRARLTYANVMATIAVFIALGGSSYAAITVTGRNVKNSSLTGRDVKNNSLTGADVKGLRSADVADRSLLAKDFKPGQLPSGPQGPKGDQGVPGTPAAKAFGAVESDGKLIYGDGVSGSTRNSGGNYTVTFTRDLTNCAVNATAGLALPQTAPGGNNAATAPAYATAWIISGGTVTVFTTAGANTPADNSFFVSAFC